MTANLQIVGEPLFAKDSDGKLKSRIATVFPEAATLITLPGIHATQRLAYIDLLNQQREKSGLPPLSACEQTVAWQSAVDLIVEDDAVLIRPDPANMPLAFRADELLQQVAGKHRVKFLYVLNQRVRDAIKRRGECWRINPLPRSPDEIKRLIAASRIGIGGR
jgi:hypothetical protein